MAPSVFPPQRRPNIIAESFWVVTLFWNNLSFISRSLRHSRNADALIDAVMVCSAWSPQHHKDTVFNDSFSTSPNSDMDRLVTIGRQQGSWCLFEFYHGEWQDGINLTTLLQVWVCRINKIK